MPEVSIPVSRLTAGDLPNVCLVTGARHDVQMKSVTLPFTPSWAYLTIFLAPLIAPLMLISLTTKHIPARIPISPKGERTISLGQTFFTLSIVLMCALLLIPLWFIVSAQVWLALITLIVATAIPFWAHRKLRRPREIAIVREDGGAVVLHVPSALAAAEIRKVLVPVAGLKKNSVGAFYVQ